MLLTVHFYAIFYFRNIFISDTWAELKICGNICRTELACWVVTLRNAFDVKKSNMWLANCNTFCMIEFSVCYWIELCDILVCCESFTGVPAFSVIRNFPRFFTKFSILFQSQNFLEIFLPSKFYWTNLGHFTNLNWVTFWILVCQILKWWLMCHEPKKFEQQCLK